MGGLHGSTHSRSENLCLGTTTCITASVTFLIGVLATQGSGVSSVRSGCADMVESTCMVTVDCVATILHPFWVSPSFIRLAGASTTIRCICAGSSDHHQAHIDTLAFWHALLWHRPQSALAAALATALLGATARTGNGARSHMAVGAAAANDALEPTLTRDRDRLHGRRAGPRRRRRAASRGRTTSL